MAATSLLAFAWAQVQAQTQPDTQTQTPEWVTTFAAGQATGTYAFPSWTPATLDQLARGRSGSPSVHVTGHLFLPAGADKVGAVVMMHGSGGVYSALLDFWPRQLNAAGFAVFTPAVFASRGVQRTIENQAAVPFAADIADAFAALRLLATHPRIDARRIAIMGFSRGGNVALRTAVQRVRASCQRPA